MMRIGKISVVPHGEAAEIEFGKKRLHVAQDRIPGGRVPVMADCQRARQAGARSTPSFFIGNRMLAGAQPFDSFRVALDSALAQAARTDR